LRAQSRDRREAASKKDATGCVGGLQKLTRFPV
jgi:hypothetical protein